MSVSVWILIVASVGAILTAAKWISESRDVSLEVGMRGLHNAFTNQGQLHEPGPLELELVNTGGSPARGLTVVITAGTGVELLDSDGWETGATPNPVMHSGSTAVSHKLETRIPSSGTYELPPLYLRDSEPGRIKAVRLRGPRTLMWEVWWRRLWWKRGRGANRLAVKLLAEEPEEE